MVQGIVGTKETSDKQLQQVTMPVPKQTTEIKTIPERSFRKTAPNNDLGLTAQDIEIRVNLK